MASEDTEITLGPVKLLGLFFLLAAICGVFFAIGYSLGRSTARDEALKDAPSQVLAAAPVPAASEAGEKPSAAVAAKAEPPAASPEPVPPSPTDSQSKLTFYKAVQQDSTGSHPPAATSSADNAGKPSEEASSTPSPAPASPKVNAANNSPEVSRSAPVTGPGTIVVQIAALSREDDAVALAGALRKKNYNVFVVNNPVTNDKLYHVQVGPFATLPEADAMKAKLTSEGYSPIVKR